MSIIESGLSTFNKNAAVCTFFVTLTYSNLAAGEVIFQESFDVQPDWTSAMHSTDTVQNHISDIIPENWLIIRQDPTWSPSRGHFDRHEVIEITSQTTSENPNRARGGDGKAFVTWRDSYDPGWNRWNSDGIMFYRLPDKGLRNIYVEFWINFSDEMIESFYANGLGSSKIFRLMSHDFPDDVNNSEYFGFFGANNKPMYIWGVDGGTQYGIRNKISIFRAGGGEPLNDNVLGFPQAFQANGDNSLWYALSATKGQSISGGDPELTDFKNNGIIKDGPVNFDQVFGDETVWVKVGHYIEMNSAPGVADGKLYQYINDQRILKGEGIEWQTREQSSDKLWNLIGIGGNDYFQSHKNSDRHEEWYAIDDILVRNDLPEHLRTGVGVSPPNPPSSVDLQ